MKVLSVSVLLLFGCHDDPPDGAQVYEDYCALCHGQNGEGYLADRANALANPEFLASADTRFLDESTRYGRPGTSMSAWIEDEGGPLTSEEIEAAVAYIQEWGTLDAVELGDFVADGDPVAGQLIYDQECAACHGEDGIGVSAVSLGNPEFLRVASDGFILYGIQMGRSGTTMGAYSHFSDNQLEDVVTAIRAWEDSE